MKLRIFVTLKPGVLDPQGRAIAHALQSLGFEGVGDVRAGKLIEMEVADGTDDAPDPPRHPARAPIALVELGAQLRIGLVGGERRLGCHHGSRWGGGAF